MATNTERLTGRPGALLSIIHGEIRNNPKLGFKGALAGDNSSTQSNVTYSDSALFIVGPVYSINLADVEAMNALARSITSVPHDQEIYEKGFRFKPGLTSSGRILRLAKLHFEEPIGNRTPQNGSIPTHQIRRRIDIIVYPSANLAKTFFDYLCGLQTGEINQDPHDPSRKQFENMRNQISEQDVLDLEKDRFKSYLDAYRLAALQPSTGTGFVSEEE